VLHADGQTDRCDEANDRFFCSPGKAPKNKALDFDSRTSRCERKHLWTLMKYGLPISSNATALSSTQANCHRERVSTLQTCLLNTAQTARQPRSLLFFTRNIPFRRVTKFPSRSVPYIELSWVSILKMEKARSPPAPPPPTVTNPDHIPWNVYHSLSGTLPTLTPTCLAFHACKRQRLFCQSRNKKIYARWNWEEVFFF